MISVTDVYDKNNPGLPESSEQVTAWINAGGRGTRLATVLPSDKHGIAKALIEVGNPPIKLIYHQLEWLARSAMNSIVVAAGSHNVVEASVFMSHHGDVKVFSRPTQLGNGGDLLRAIREQPELFDERNTVFVTNADTVVDLDVGAFESSHRRAGSALTIALTGKKDVPNEGAYGLDETGAIIYCGEASSNLFSAPELAETATRRLSSMGAAMVNLDFLYEFDWKPEEGQLSFYSSIIGRALEQRTLGAFDAGDSFMMDIGTPDNYKLARETAVLQPYLCYPDHYNV